MAAARHRFAVATLAAAVDTRPESLPSIRGFCFAACGLLRQTLLLDATISTEPALALVEVLNWLANTVLDNLVHRVQYPADMAPAESAGIDTASRFRVAVFKRAVNGAVSLARISTPDWVPNVQNVPAQSVFEIFYEVVIATAAANTVAAAIAAIRNANNSLQWPAGLYGRLPAHGYPKVFWICAGQNAVGAPVTVVAANQVNFVHKDLQKWSKAMRDSTLGAPYEDQAKSLWWVAFGNKHMLQHTWDNPDGRNREEALMWMWGNILKMQPDGGPVPTEFTRPTGHASAYTFEAVAGERARCMRCRVVYRYSMVLEPAVYNEGPFTYWETCAEVQGHLKCLSAGMA